MASTGTFSGYTTAVWLLVSGTSAFGGQDRRLELYCGEDMRQSLYEALVDDLHAKFPQGAVTTMPRAGHDADLTLHYVAQNRSNDWVAGHLTWRHRDGRSGKGPTVEQTVMDQMLTAEDFSMFAGHLVSLTEFPL